MSWPRCLQWICLAMLLTLWPGCTSKPVSVPETTDDAGTRGGTDSGSATGAAPQKPAERLEPFDPPPLAELDAKAQWENQPVWNAIDLLRERQAKERPLATTAEALRLKNDSTANNQKIAGAIGRLPASDVAVNYEATVLRHTAADVRSTNPIMASSTIEQELGALLVAPLFTFDWNFTPFGNDEVLVSWQSSKDRMYDKAVLRDDLTWSDGTPFTAHDVEFSFQTIMDPRVPVPAVRSGTEKLRWVEAYDDRTVVFFHKEALATNAWYLQFPVIPKHIYEVSLNNDPTLQDSDHHAKYEDSPVCSGRYTITQRSRGQSMVLTRRESWYMHNGKQVREKPYFKEIRIRVMEDPNPALLALKGGDIEEMELTPDQWTTQTVDEDFYRRNTKISGLQWAYFYFGWNNDRELAPFFTDKRVRQAMSYAFDHEELLNTLLYGLYEPCNGDFHKTAWMAPKNPPQPYTQDLDKAEDLLDQAGWVDSDNDGIRDKTTGGRKVNFEFTILCSNNPTRIAICTLLKTSLEQVGVRCHVSPLDFPTLQEKTRTHKFQAFFGGWGTGADPDISSNVWVTGEGRNFVQYSNPQIDRLFEQGRKELNRAKRAEIYGRIHEILYEDQPYTWLYFRNGFYGINKDLRGFVISPKGPYTYSPGFDSLWKGMQ